MKPTYSFEAGMSHAFRAPHVKSFVWKYAVAYAVILTFFVMLVGWMARGAFTEVSDRFQSLDQTNPNPESAGEVFSILFGAMGPLFPFILLLTFGSILFWAVFEAASQRRYIWDQDFSLGLGGDEMRMFVVGLLWFLLGLVLYGLPILAIFGGMISSLVTAEMQNTDPDAAILAGVFGGLGMMLLVFPLYVFFATRLAPCFGLTMKDKKIKFFDAWNVSRGRFWPILGGFVIISVAGGMVSGIISQVFQTAMLPFIVDSFENVDESNIGAVFTSPGFLILSAIYLFISFLLQGVLQHFKAAPAAFAARHDPRGGVDDDDTLQTFD